MNSTLFQSVAAPTMAAALDARYISGLKVINTPFITFKIAAAFTCSSTMFALHTPSHNYTKLMNVLLALFTLQIFQCINAHCFALQLMYIAWIHFVRFAYAGLQFRVKGLQHLPSYMVQLNSRRWCAQSSPLVFMLAINRATNFILFFTFFCCERSTVWAAISHHPKRIRTCKLNKWHSLLLSFPGFVVSFSDW